MDFNAAAWQKECGRSLPPLMSRCFEWLMPFDYGDLGQFELQPTNLAESTGWDDMARWGATTWGFMNLPDGSIIALCEAVTPPAVVYVGSEGELRTIAESFEAFLLSWAAGDSGIDELTTEDDELEEGQANAFEAFDAWLKKHRVTAPEVSGQFEFSSYAEGDPPRRIVPGQKPSAPAPSSAHYLALADGMGPTLRSLCDLLGRTADDAELCSVTQRLFGKAPPQAIGHLRHGDEVIVHAEKLALELTFSCNVLNRQYPPVPAGEKATCPYFSRVDLLDDEAEPFFFGLRGDALWAEIARRWPESLSVTSGDDGPGKHCSLMLDETRDIRLELWSTATGTHGHAELAQGRELESREGAADISSGAGLFIQWAIENDRLNRAMFAGHEPLLDGMRGRQVRPSRLVDAALDRGLWDTHLTDEPGLRAFAFQYFRHLHSDWITTDLKRIFGKREGRYGHDEPVLDDDPPQVYDPVFAQFGKQFEAWKKAHPDRL